MSVQNIYRSCLGADRINAAIKKRKSIVKASSNVFVHVKCKKSYTKKKYIFRSKEDIVQGILAINEKMTE